MGIAWTTAPPPERVLQDASTPPSKPPPLWPNYDPAKPPALNLALAQG